MRTAAPRDGQNHDTLLPNAGAFAAALVLAALTAPLPWQPAAAQAAVPCTAIENNEERLACYDRALRATSSAPASQAPAAPAAQTPAAQGAAGSAAPAPSSSAVAEEPRRERNVRESTAPAAPEAAAAGRDDDDDEDRIVPIVIVGVRTLPGRETTFTAQDGGIWVQTDSQRVVGLPDTPFDAEIRPGAIGSSFLVPKERGRAIRVRSADR